MYISHKSNVIQAVHGLEWKCRMITKGMNNNEYHEMGRFYNFHFW